MLCADSRTQASDQRLSFRPALSRGGTSRREPTRSRAYINLSEISEVSVETVEMNDQAHPARVVVGLRNITAKFYLLLLPYLIYCMDLSIHMA